MDEVGDDFRRPSVLIESPDVYKEIISEAPAVCAGMTTMFSLL